MNLFELQGELRVLMDNVTSLYWQVQWAIGEKEQAQKSPSEEGQESQ